MRVFLVCCKPLQSSFEVVSECCDRVILELLESGVSSLYYEDSLSEREA